MTVELREYDLNTGEVGSVIAIVDNGATFDLRTILPLENYAWFRIEGGSGGANLSRYTDGMGYDTLVATANSVRNTPPEKRRKVVAHETTIFGDNNTAVRVVPLDDPN